MISKYYILVFSVFACLCSTEPIVAAKLEKYVECLAAQSIDPLAMGMSPGFLAGAISYIGPQACTESGMCKKSSLICPSSSCCVSNNTIPSSDAFGYSQCGCWDSKQNTCKPLRHFRLGWDICNPATGHQLKFDYELASLSNVDEEIEPSVEFEDVSNNAFHLHVVDKRCMMNSRAQRIGDLLCEAGRVCCIVSFICLILDSRPLLKELRDAIQKEELSKSEVEHLLEYLSDSGENSQSKDVKLDCRDQLGNASISMTPNFLPESLSNILSEQSQVCGVQGECKLSSPACKTTGCCLMSHGQNATECECITDSGDCILDHKVFKVDGLTCATNGDRTKANIEMKIPSKDLIECSESRSFVKYALNDIGNVEITVDTTQCILSSVNNKFLEVEAMVKAEVNGDTFFNVLRKLR